MLWIGTGDGLLTVYTIHDRSHLRHYAASHPVKDSNKCRAKQHRPQQQHLRHVENGKAKKIKAHRRLNREQSRSHEMLLNGMLEDDDDDDVGVVGHDGDGTDDDSRTKPKIRERRDHADELRQARLARRMRLQETRFGLGSNNRVNVKGTTPIVRPSSVSDLQTGGGVVNGLNARARKGGVSSDDKQCRAAGRPQMRSTKTSRLQRQKGLIQNGPPCSASDERLSRDDGKVDSVTSRGQHPGAIPDQRKPAQTSPATQQSGLGGIRNEVKHNDSVFVEEFHPVISVSCTSGDPHTDASPMPQPINPGADRRVHSGDAQLPMLGHNIAYADNKTRRQLPGVFKNTLGKAHAPPQESTVTAGRSRPTSTSESLTDESDLQYLASGLIQDLKPETVERKGQTPKFPGESVRSAEYALKIVNNKRPITAVGSTSSTCNSKGSSSKAVASAGLAPEQDGMSAPVPEIEIYQHDGGQLFRNMSKSLEVLDQQPAVLDSGPTLGISSADVMFGGSTPDLSRRNLRPPAFGHRLDGTASSSTMSSGSFSDLTYFIDLSVDTKVKVSDRPVKCLIPTR